MAPARSHILDQSRQGSAQAAVEEAIARITAENPKLNAVGDLFADEARARAERLDRMAAEGAALGLLHGVPVLIKELVDIAGTPTRFGSRAYAPGAAPRNAAVIDRLEAAGAIILGTAHMVEFAFGSWGTNAVRGTPWNPADRDVQRAAGGSSSGSAVAVGAGFVPIAFGSDTGGSIRIPATLCGVVGYKPSYGLIPMQGVAPTGPTFDTLGPLTTSVADARRATEAAAGVSLAHEKVTFEGLRVACVGNDALEPIDPACLAAYEHARKILLQAGAELGRIELPGSFVDLQQINGDIVAFEAYRHLWRLVDDPLTDLDPNVRSRVANGAQVTEARYQNQLATQQRIRARFHQAFRGFDVLLLPGTPLPAPALADIDETAIPMSRYTRAGNCLNLCAIALPIPVEASALPVGIQLACSAGADAKLLALAEAFETIS